MLQSGHRHTKGVGDVLFLYHDERKMKVADKRDTTQEQETNEENDAREEDIVRDTDADTNDVLEEQRDDSAETERRFAGIEATLDKILGELSSIREAQGIMVENGAVINDTVADIGHIEEDEFDAPLVMDLLV